MRILVLGGRGMLGHKVWEILSNSMDVYATIRGSFDDLEELGSFDKNKIISGIDALDFSLLERKIEELSPDVVLNCIGIVKQIEDAEDAIKSIEINSLFPHRLSSLCARINSRLMHLSTDCVFSGKKGELY